MCHVVPSRTGSPLVTVRCGRAAGRRREEGALEGRLSVSSEKHRIGSRNQIADTLVTGFQGAKLWGNAARPEFGGA